MEIKKAVLDDIPRIMEIYDYARVFMAENGNPTQWDKSYPSVDMIKNDIALGNSYVCIQNAEIVGVFAFILGEEPTYKIIQDGSWRKDSPYGTIHRIAGNGKEKGVAACCFDYCKSQIAYLRVDTHADNIPMQKAILKNGFTKCGVIHVEDGSARFAYDYF